MQTAQNEVLGTLVSCPSKLVLDLCHQAARDLTIYPDKQAEDLLFTVLVQVRTAALAAYYEEVAQLMPAAFSACAATQTQAQEKLLQLSRQLGLQLARAEAAAAAAVASMQSAQPSTAPQ